MAEELNRIADEGVEEEELLLEQSRTIGQKRHQLRLIRFPGKVLRQLRDHGDPLDNDQTTLQEITRLTPESVREVAAKYFTEDWFVVVAGEWTRTSSHWNS